MVVQQHDPKKWRNQVAGQCMSWIDGGLRSSSNDYEILEWGVKVPVEGGDGKVLYVWLDAPIGYISATKQWALRESEMIGKTTGQETENSSTSSVKITSYSMRLFSQYLLKAHERI